MKSSVVYFTNRHCYSVEEAEEELRDKVSAQHWGLLRSNITHIGTALTVVGFLEKDEELYLLYGDELHSPSYFVC